jgi:hypothetical protein
MEFTHVLVNFGFDGLFSVSFPSKPRTIFHRAMDASELKWHDPHLKLILRRDPTYPDCPMWHGE